MESPVVAARTPPRHLEAIGTVIDLINSRDELQAGPPSHGKHLALSPAKLALVSTG